MLAGSPEERREGAWTQQHGNAGRKAEDVHSKPPGTSGSDQ